jgi:hypothetical protein
MADKNCIFGKGNYAILVAGMLVLITGFILMGAFSFSSSGDIYSFRKITLSPVFIITGYGLLILSIFKT